MDPRLPLEDVDTHVLQYVIGYCDIVWEILQLIETSYISHVVGRLRWFKH